VKKPSNAQTISLTNSGDASLTISSIAITGTNPADYSQTNDCGTSLPVNTTCSINVVFKPLGLDTRTASVAITDNATGSPQAISLTGVGTQVKITPIALKFGIVVVGASSTKILTVANVGITAVHFAGISFTGSNPGDFSDTSACGPTVATEIKVRGYSHVHSIVERRALGCCSLQRRRRRQSADRPFDGHRKIAARTERANFAGTCHCSAGILPTVPRGVPLF